MSHPPFLLNSMVNGTASGCGTDEVNQAFARAVETRVRGLEGKRGLNETCRMSAAGGSSRAAWPFSLVEGRALTPFVLC